MPSLFRLAYFLKLWITREERTMVSSDSAELPFPIKGRSKDDAPLMEAALRLLPDWDKAKDKQRGAKLADFTIEGMLPGDKELKIRHRNGKTFTVKYLDDGSTRITTDDLEIRKNQDGSRTYWDRSKERKLLGFRSADRSTTYLLNDDGKTWSVIGRDGKPIADHPFHGQELVVEKKEGSPTGKLTLPGTGGNPDKIVWMDGRTGVFDKTKTEGALTVTYPDNRVETFDRDGAWRSTQIGDTTYKATYWKYGRDGKELERDKGDWATTPWSLHRVDMTVNGTTTTPFQRVADPTRAVGADVVSIARTPDGLITAVQKDGTSTTINPIDRSRTVTKGDEKITTYEGRSTVEVKKEHGGKVTATIYGPDKGKGAIYTAELASFDGPPYTIKALHNKDGELLVRAGRRTTIEHDGDKITARFNPPLRHGDTSPKLKTATYNLDGTRDLSFNDGHTEKRTAGGWMVSSKRDRDRNLDIEYRTTRDGKFVTDRDGAAPKKITVQPAGTTIEHSLDPATSEPRYTLKKKGGEETTYHRCSVDRKGTVHLYDKDNVHWVLNPDTGEAQRFSPHSGRDGIARRLGEGRIRVGEDPPGRTHKRHGVDHDVRRIKIDDKRDVTLDSSRFTTRSGTMERSVVRNPEGGQMSRILKDAETGEVRSLYWTGKNGKHYCLENEAGQWQKYELTSGTWKKGTWKPVGDRKDIKFDGQDSHGRLHATLTERGKTVHRVFGRSLTVYQDMDDKQFAEYKRTGKVATERWKPNKTF